MGSPQRSRRKCREKLSDFLCVHCVLPTKGLGARAVSVNGKVKNHRKTRQVTTEMLFASEILKNKQSLRIDKLPTTSR